MSRTDPSSRLSPRCRTRVLRRLGFDSPPDTDLRGLRALYRAWGCGVPFDNLSKMIALRTDPEGPLPGLDAEAFFDAWLREGCGGTCWATSNALFALASAVGFEARRVAGAMWDLGVVSHGSVIVRLESRDWLIDSSFLFDAPLPLDARVYVHADPLFHVEVEPDDGTHLLWLEAPPAADLIPCRLMIDPAAAALYRERYEASRAQSPFNQRLYARRNRPGETLVFVGHKRVAKTSAGLAVETLSAGRLCECLHEELGLGTALIERWVAAGGLSASFEPPAAATPPAPPARSPPSRR